MKRLIELATGTVITAVVLVAFASSFAWAGSKSYYRGDSERTYFEYDVGRNTYIHECQYWWRGETLHRKCSRRVKQPTYGESPSCAKRVNYLNEQMNNYYTKRDNTKKVALAEKFLRTWIDSGILLCPDNLIRHVKQLAGR